jgi:hypothetical protein
VSGRGFDDDALWARWRLDAGSRPPGPLVEESPARRLRHAVQTTVGRLRRGLARRVAGKRMPRTAYDECPAPLAWNDAGAGPRGPSLPERFVVIDEHGIAHGPFAGNRIRRDDGAFEIAGLRGLEPLRVISHRLTAEAIELWTEDDQHLRVVELAP